MFLDKIDGILPAQWVKVKYECDGGFERCGKEWSLKLKDALKNHEQNNGKLICRSCQMKNNNPMKRKDVRDKVKKTTLEKYGVTCVMNTKENKETQKKKYEDPEFVKQVQEKRRETCIEKYGVDHPMKTEEIQEKQAAVIREKYGVDHPLQNKDILEKVKKTNLEKYGTEWGLSSPEVRLKGVETMLGKYGVTHYNQLPEMKEYLRQNCTEWLADSYKNPWAKGIERPQEWNDKQREAVRKKIEAGDWAGGFISNFKGRFPAWKCKKEKPRFLSMLEAKYHFYLNTNPLVEWYNYEGLVIEYTKTDGTKHDYYVDFQVKYFDDNILHNFEVKAWKNKDKLDTQIKYTAAVDYCNEHNMTYSMLFDEDIAKLNIEDETIINFPAIEIQ